MIYHKYVVIGGGKTGIDTALLLAQRGLDVVLIEENDVGGSYVFSKDLPKEFLAAQSHSVQNFRRRLPIEIQRSLTIDLESIISKKIKQRYAKILDQCKRFDNLKIIKGTAFFGSKNILEIHIDDTKTIIAFEQCIITSGLSKMHIPPIKGLSNISFLYQHNAFYGDCIPSQLGIIGLTHETIEVADIYANLGTKVSIFEKKAPEEVLPHQDTTAINYILQNLLTKGVEFYFNAEITEITEDNNTLTCIDQERNSYRISHVYCTVRESFVNSLALEVGEIKFSHKGIYTSGNGQTNHKHIFAFGACANSFGSVDTTSQILQYIEKQAIHTTHSDATKRTIVLVNHQTNQSELAIIDFPHEKINTQKPIATIGLPYREAIQRIGSYAKFMVLIDDDLDGFIKLIYNDQTNQIYGISLTGDACKSCYSFAIEAIHNGINIQELRSMLICLGYRS